MISGARVRLPAVFAIAAVMAASSAAAQPAEWRYDRLNDALQQRYSQTPAGEEIAPPPAAGDSGAATRGLQPIAPEQRARKYHQLKKDDGTGRSPQASLPQAATAELAGSPRTRTRSLIRTPEPAAVIDTAQPVPVAKPNSYVIQLKPETTGEQLDALLAKYKLRVVSDELLKIGSIIVEQSAPSQRTSQARSFNKIEDILEPKIIRDLRKERAVKEAFVNAVVAPKWLPKPVTTQVLSESSTYHWRWGKTDVADGNWGLKYLRLPAVWSIVKSHRAKNPDKGSPVIGVIDVGFGKHDDLDFKAMLDTPIAQPLAGASPCSVGHGTHVAGVAGSKFDNDFGIDGAAPDIGIEVVGVKADFALEGPEAQATSVDSVLMLYTDVLKTATKYVVPNLGEASRLRVVNLSLAYNWYNILGKKNPADNRILQRHISSEAALFKTLAELAQDKILFVVAAGNDSRGWDVPLEAKWASSIAWAGTHQTPNSKPSANIIVVEAFDREGKRADFSNRGGHVAAPGVGIMSTAVTATGRDFALCSGTSQAAPHIAAIAAMLFELAPDKKPSEVADVLKKTARASSQRHSAGQVDPLNAALELSPHTLSLLADLTGDGEVNKKDLALFAQRLHVLQQAGPPTPDPAQALISSVPEAGGNADPHNDGLADSGKVWWPRVDLNGSGLASFDNGDERPVCNALRSDLDIIKLAWQDRDQSFEQASAEIQLANPSSGLTAAAVPQAGQTARASETRSGEARRDRSASSCAATR